MKTTAATILLLLFSPGLVVAQACNRPSPLTCPSLYTEDCTTFDTSDMTQELRAACIAIKQGIAKDETTCSTYDPKECNVQLSASKSVEGLECRAFKLHYSAARKTTDDTGDVTQDAVNKMYSQCRANGKNIFSHSIQIIDGKLQIPVVQKQDGLAGKLPENGPDLTGSNSDICKQQIQGFEQSENIAAVRAEFEAYKTESQELFTCSVWFEKMKDCILDIEQAFADHSTGSIDELPLRAQKWQAYEAFTDGFDNNSQRFETMLKQVETQVLDLELQKDAMECP